MFEGLDIYQITFWICAVGGTTFFILRTAAGIFGGMDHDLDVHSGSGHDVSHHGADSSDTAFNLISITTLTGFFMMFGWVGLAFYDQAQFGSGLSLLIAFLAGLGTMYTTALIFKGARKLSGSGSHFDLGLTVGQKANVYQRIPAAGKGRIQIMMADVTHEIDAISEDGKDIESFTNVQVVRVVNSETVSVKSA